MLIRSQDRKILVNMNNVMQIGGQVIPASPDEKLWILANSSILGEYSTEEKMIKVLDMIQEHYDKVIDSRYWNDTYQDNTFQMPQDCEVQP